VREVVDETFGKALDHPEARLRSEAAAVYAAFSAVCQDRIKLEPEVVLHAVFAPLAV
jgi:hypothetical protein